MRILQTTIFGISRLAAFAACLTLVGMVAHILIEIVLRYFFSSSTFVLDEFVGYAVAATTFLSLGYSLEHGSLIRVSLLIGRAEGPMRRLLEAVCALAGLFVAGLLVWYFWLRVARHWTRGTVSSSIAEVPMWIPEGAILLGLAVFWLQLLAYLLRQITGEAPPVAVQDSPTE